MTSRPLKRHAPWTCSIRGAVVESDFGVRPIERSLTLLLIVRYTKPVSNRFDQILRAQVTRRRCPRL